MLRDEIFWRTLLRTVIFTAASVVLTIGLGTLIALPAHSRLGVGARAADGRPRPRLVDAGGRRRPGVVLDDELPERDPELRADRARRRRLHRSTTGTRRSFSKLAMVTLLIVWGAIPFVDDHGLRGAGSGAARARRGGRDRRCGAAARVPRRDVPDPEADLPHPHEPLDHLGLRRLHAAVPADRRIAHRPHELPHGRLRLHRGASGRATSGEAPRSRFSCCSSSRC